MNVTSVAKLVLFERRKYEMTVWKEIILLLPREILKI